MRQNSATTTILLSFVGLIFAAGSVVYGHCEIPCGIYDDKTRIGMLREHARTVEKSMKKIESLQKKDKDNANQLIRWTVNKEEHAQKIQDIVHQYFMNQRVKPAAEGEDGYQTYVHQVTILHQIAVQAMKCKQTTDQEHVEKLRSLIDTFEDSYFSDEGEEEQQSGHTH